MRKLSNLLQVHDSITIPVSELAELLSLCADPLRFCQFKLQSPTRSTLIRIYTFRSLRFIVSVHVANIFINIDAAITVLVYIL